MASIDMENEAIIDSWHIIDVKDRSEGQFKEPLTDDECWQVLELMADKHDCNNGLTWNLMDYCIDQLFSDRERLDEEEDVSQTVNV